MMYSGDEDFGDDVTSGFLTAEEREQYEDEETAPCNDCGRPCPKFDELCSECYDERLAAEEWDGAHPEVRCPPRE